MAKKKINEAKMQKIAGGALKEFQEAAQGRYRRAKVVYDAQDSETQDSLDRMIDLLGRTARKTMWVSASKGSSQKVLVPLPGDAIHHNTFYMAVEILKDLGQMDVKVGGFTFPKDVCAVCSTPIKKKVK